MAGIPLPVARVVNVVAITAVSAHLTWSLATRGDAAKIFILALAVFAGTLAALRPTVTVRMRRISIGVNVFLMGWIVLFIPSVIVAREALSLESLDVAKGFAAAGFGAAVVIVNVWTLLARVRGQERETARPDRPD